MDHDDGRAAFGAFGLGQKALDLPTIDGAVDHGL